MRTSHIEVLAAGLLVIFTSSYVECKKGRPPGTCKESEIRCVSGSCIGKALICDGIPHCPDGSDETSDACGNILCPNYMFRCNYGACVTISSICNGVFNCADQSDEPPISSCKIPGYNNNVPTQTTKRYTPYPINPETTPESRPTNKPKPDTTTKKYTPYPPFGSSPSSASSGTKSTIKTTTGTAVTPSIPTDGSCKLPSNTPDKSYTINDCVPTSTDPFCQKKPGEYVISGAVLNFQCKTQDLTPETDTFSAYCLEGQWLPEIVPCKYCGTLTKKVQANTHIPWEVSIYENSSNQAICGGSIISPYIVISAAHCFFDATINWKKEPSNFYILVGKQSRNPVTNKYQRYNVTDVRFSPDGFQGSYTNFASDIAVIEISAVFQFDSEISTVCFDSSSEKYSEEFETSGLVSLYNNNGGSSGYTETTRLPVTSYEQCVQAVSDVSKPLVTLDKICVLARDIEYGNGGNGFYTFEANQANYRLRGILSTTFRDSRTNGQVATLTDIAKHLFWLSAKVDEINQRRKIENVIDIRFPHKK